jgi:hypothetical protein
MLLLVSFNSSTQTAVNEWATRTGVLKTEHILYDDMAYLDPFRFPNAVSNPKPTWGTIDAKAPDYLVLSSSIYGTPHYQALIKDQKLNRDDPIDYVTGAYSVRVYQDLLPYDQYGSTALPGIDYVAEIKAVPITYMQPAWNASQQPIFSDWALSSVWWSELWIRYSSVLLQYLFSSETQPIQGPTFRIYRIHRLDDGQRARYAGSCNNSEMRCTDFKRMLTRGETVDIAFDNCSSDLRIISCGKNYTIRYWKEGDSWCSSTSGPQAGKQEEYLDYRACQGNPEEGIISLLSIAFVFNGRGEVYYLTSGRPPALVAHIKP